MSLTLIISASFWPKVKWKDIFEKLRTHRFWNWPFFLNLVKIWGSYGQNANWQVFCGHGVFHKFWRFYKTQSIQHSPVCVKIQYLHDVVVGCHLQPASHNHSLFRRAIDNIDTLLRFWTSINQWDRVAAGQPQSCPGLVISAQNISQIIWSTMNHEHYSTLCENPMFSAMMDFSYHSRRTHWTHLKIHLDL